MPKKNTSTIKVDLLPCNDATDSLKQAQMEVREGLSEAVAVLRELIADSQTPPGVRLGAAQSLVKAMSAVQQATDTAESEKWRFTMP